MILKYQSKTLQSYKRNEQLQQLEKIIKNTPEDL